MSTAEALGTAAAAGGAKVEVEGASTPPSGPTLLLLARTLDYPGATTAAARAELQRLLAAARPAAARSLEAHREAVDVLSLHAQQELYAATFDTNPSVCLYVGYHLFGDSYQRGAFMAHLNGTYGESGFETGQELPDHLSVVLRFLAHSEVLEEPAPGLEGGRDAWVAELIDEAIVPATRAIVRSFEGTENPYAALLAAVLETVRRPGDEGGGRNDRTRARSLPVMQTHGPPETRPPGAAGGWIARRPEHM
ncbi:MAG: molecular chaperone TorD family protein [Gemmatimonadota bacterium]